MFIFKVDYLKPIEEVERYLAAHREYLDLNFKEGKLVASGPQEPRTGGVIIANVSTRSQADEIISGDPFFIHGIANYTVIHFHATKSSVANFESGIE